MPENESGVRRGSTHVLLTALLLASYLAGVGSVFAFGHSVGNTLANLGVRFARAAEAPVIHMANEDEAKIGAILDAKLEQRLAGFEKHLIREATKLAPTTPAVAAKKK
jgi:hypothetical protein